MKSRYFIGVSAAALSAMAALWAAPSYAATAAAEAEQSPATVGELVVTAEKRNENIETVAVAVSAFTSEQRDLVGIKSIQDLSDFTPGLFYSTYDNRPYIRGIGRQTDNLAVETGVAIYLDGVYNGANGSTILQTDSLFTDRIEVLRGPQSTLYGRNADGGAINYISVKPTSDYEAEVRAGAGNYDKYFVEGAVSGPITPTLNFRLGANETSQTGGWDRNLNGPAEGGGVAQGGNGTSYHVEGQLDWKPSSNFEWWVKGATSDYNVTFHTQTLIGPLDTREFYNALGPNQNFGLCGLPGGAAANAQDCAGNPDTIVPGSVITLSNTILTNPSGLNPRTFDADFRSDSRQNTDAIFASAMTYHAPSFDIKYLFGFQTFYYDLDAPILNVEGLSSSVEQYTLKGPTVQTGLCTLVFDNAGCTQNLQINPAHTEFTFIEKEFFFSHELNFASTGNGPLQWIAGLYWYHEGYNQPINALTPEQPQVYNPVAIAPFFGPAAPNPTGSVYNEDTALIEDSYAAFGQFDWKINDQFKLTGGVRYTSDHKHGEEQFRVILFDFEGAGLGVNTFGADTPAFDVTSCPAGTFPGAGPCTVNPATGKAMRRLDGNWDAVTGVANISWTPNPETLVYLKYSRGYKTGGFNSGQMFPFPETQPETVDAVEGGWKQTVGSAIEVNAAAFYYNYKNDQQPVNTPGSNGVISSIIFNIPSVHIYGVELESFWRPFRDLTLSANYAYLHATVASTNDTCLEDTADPMAIEPGANFSGCPAASGGIQTQNILGATIPQSPRNKISLNALYAIHMEPGTLTLSGTFTWRDSEYDSLFNRSYNESPSFSQVNLRATFTDTSNRYSIVVFCDNVFNTLGYDGTDGLLVTNPGPGQIVDKEISLIPPRTYGVELQYRFK